MLSKEQLQELNARAKLASAHAYAPYSRFRVGAAVMTKSGKIFSGCNVENASYGLTICAERVAIFQAVAQGEKDIEGVAVYTPTEKPTSPCGACRQVINEFGPKSIVWSTCDGTQTLSLTADQLLPEAFGPKNLF